MRKKTKGKRKPCSICGRTHIKVTKAKCVRHQLWSTLKECVSRRDEMICQRCGVLTEGDNSHMSHVIRASRCGRLKFDLQNVKVLCESCHFGWWHKDEVEAGLWFVETWPERWAYLQSRQKEYRAEPGSIGMSWHVNRLEELRQWRDDFDERVHEFEQQKNPELGKLVPKLPYEKPPKGHHD